MTDQESPRNAILQRDKETYAVVPRLPAGMVKVEDLKAIVNVVEKYKIPVIKITSGHRLALVGMKADEVNKIWDELNIDAGKATELCLHYVQACPGDILCQYGAADSIGLGTELEEMFAGADFPAKVKIGVSGCSFCCAESFVRDVGIFGKRKGWTLIFGGNSARRPRVGDIIAENLDTDQVKALTKRCLDYYAENARKKERAARFIERIGIEAFKEAVL